MLLQVKECQHPRKLEEEVNYPLLDNFCWTEQSLVHNLTPNFWPQTVREEIFVIGHQVYG